MGDIHEIMITGLDWSMAGASGSEDDCHPIGVSGTGIPLIFTNLPSLFGR